MDVRRPLMGFLWEYVRRSPVPAVALPPILDPTLLYEEETLPSYRPERFYPVKLGELLHGRYAVVTKLGFGMSSTIWLAKDTRKYWPWQTQYVALKVHVGAKFLMKTPDTELSIMQHIAATQSKSWAQGFQYLRTPLDSFILDGPDSPHTVFVFEPLRETLAQLQQRAISKKLPSYLVQSILKCVLMGLDALHTQCQIIHTDLKADNILMGLERGPILEDVVKDEAESPVPRKEATDRHIYASRHFGRYKHPPRDPKISDFGVAVRGNVTEPYTYDIQPNCYRAPEVILGAGWTYSADIWNLGVMLWDLLENKSLLYPFDPVTKRYSSSIHFQQLERLLGPCPPELRHRAESLRHTVPYDGQSLLPSSSSFPDGYPALKSDDRGHEEVNRQGTLEESLPSMSGGDKDRFLAFVRRMLKWKPEDRATAAELLQDPWVTMPLKAPTLK